MRRGAEFGKDLDWTYGLPGARVAKALADWQVNELPGEYYQMLNASGEDIGLLLKAFGLEVSAKRTQRIVMIRARIALAFVGVEMVNSFISATHINGEYYTVSPPRLHFRTQSHVSPFHVSPFRD